MMMRMVAMVMRPHAVAAANRRRWTGAIGINTGQALRFRY